MSANNIDSMCKCDDLVFKLYFSGSFKLENGQLSVRPKYLLTGIKMVPGTWKHSRKQRLHSDVMLV